MNTMHLHVLDKIVGERERERERREREIRMNIKIFQIKFIQNTSTLAPHPFVHLYKPIKH